MSTNRLRPAEASVDSFDEAAWESTSNAPRSKKDPFKVIEKIQAMIDAHEYDFSQAGKIKPGKVAYEEILYLILDGIDDPMSPEQVRRFTAVFNAVLSRTPLVLAKVVLAKMIDPRVITP